MDNWRDAACSINSIECLYDLDSIPPSVASSSSKEHIC